MILDILNPGTTLRIWTVTGKTVGYGHFKSFWFRRNADVYAANNSYPWVFIRNEIWDEERCIKAPKGYEWQLDE